ncbi:hypothetical protein DFH09DRAFT_407332 [Mycena vulgaris]|nr:hypothetical protein DFH09DRAFT_407332 [Mycena vulgaris]
MWPACAQTRASRPSTSRVSSSVARARWAPPLPCFYPDVFLMRGALPPSVILIIHNPLPLQPLFPLTLRRSSPPSPPPPLSTPPTPRRPLPPSFLPQRPPKTRPRLLPAPSPPLAPPRHRVPLCLPALARATQEPPHRPRMLCIHGETLKLAPQSAPSADFCSVSATHTACRRRLENGIPIGGCASLCPCFSHLGSRPSALLLITVHGASTRDAYRINRHFEHPERPEQIPEMPAQPTEMCENCTVHRCAGCSLVRYCARPPLAPLSHAASNSPSTRTVG